MIYANMLKRITRSEGLILAAIPFIGTFVAFIFEYGYLAFYDVPISVIQLDFTRIVTAAAIIVLSCANIAMAFTAIALVARGNHPIRKALISPLITALFFSVFIFFIPGSPERWWIVAAVLILHLLFEFIPPLFKAKSTGSYINALASQIREENKKSDTTKLSAKDYLSAFFFGSMFIIVVGLHHASVKTSYWTLSTHPDMVVIEIYGDTVVLKSYDPKTRKLGDNLVLISRASIEALSMKKVTTGPLSSSKPKS